MVYPLGYAYSRLGTSCLNIPKCCMSETGLKPDLLFFAHNLFAEGDVSLRERLRVSRLMRKYLTTFATMKNINSDQLMFLPLSQSLDLPHFLLYLNGVLGSFLLFQHFFFQPLLSICMFLLQFYRILCF